MKKKDLYKIICYIEDEILYIKHDIKNCRCLSIAGAKEELRILESILPELKNVLKEMKENGRNEATLTVLPWD